MPTKYSWLLTILLFSFFSACSSYRVLLHEPTPRVSQIEPQPEVLNTSITRTSEPNYFKIQIALILDTSGSMENLLEQAKAEFWYLVDELLYAYQDYGDPVLEIALLEYGNKDLGARNAYMRIVTPLTQELDWVSSELYNLVPRGKYEYCGEAIQLAAERLAWSEYPEDVRMIFIAGNESFRQGMTRPQIAINQANEWGIRVNTIFCGDYDEGIRLGWEDGALQGGGTYTAINMYQDVAWYNTPYDAQICDLNAQLNLTYIPYGTRGNYYWDRFRQQDEWAGRYGNSNLCIRTLVKSNYYYWNANWDLVDAYASGRVDCRLIPDEEWPRDLRRLSWSERESILIQKVAERKRIQNRLRDLSQMRRKQVRIIAEREERRPNTVSSAIIRSTRQEVRRPAPGSKRPDLSLESRRPVSDRTISPPARSPRQSTSGRTVEQRDPQNRIPQTQQRQADITTRPDRQRMERQDERRQAQPQVIGRRIENQPIEKNQQEARRKVIEHHTAQERARREQQQQEAGRRADEQRAAQERARREQQQQEARRRADEQRAAQERARREQQQQEARRRADEQKATLERARREQQQQEARRRADEQKATLERARREQQQQEARKRTDEQRAAQERARREQQQQEARKRADDQRAALERARREQQQQEARRRADEQRAAQERARREQQQQEARRRADEQHAAQERARREQQQQEARRRADEQRAAQERARREQQQQEARRRADEQRAAQERARREQQQQEARRRADEQRAAQECARREQQQQEARRRADEQRATQERARRERQQQEANKRAAESKSRLQSIQSRKKR